MNKKDLVLLDLDITKLRQEITSLKKQSLTSFDNEDNIKKLEEKLEEKLLFQKEVDYNTYRLNCSTKEKVKIEEQLTNKDRYNRLNTSIRQVIDKHDYDYIQDKSGIFSLTPDLNCKVVQEINRARLKVENMDLTRFYKDRDWRFS